MGVDYKQWNPKVMAVTELAFIDAVVSNAEELELLLGDPRIVRAEHIGLHSIVEITY